MSSLYLSWSQTGPAVTYRPPLEALLKKLSASVLGLRRLAGSGWDAIANTSTAAPFLVYSTAEYCAPVWCRSAHTRINNIVLNNALRIHWMPSSHSNRISFRSVRYPPS